MKSYVVGGAVRDALLGLPGADRDWVVVGATPEQMSALGYTPVGRDFPVFLHPVTHEEYALARTERKSGRGYRGFTVFAAPEVTLEEDLRRRDLTINAIARAEDGSLIDPFGGQQDLRAGLLRHVSPAFAEDPVRILRVARFAARFRFTVAEDTQALMQSMVAAGEADFLVPERVWQEFARGLCERHPEEMFRVLERCGALQRLAPELHAIFAGEARGAALEALERAAVAGAPLARRFAVLAWFVRPDAANACAQELAALCEKLRAPLEVRDLAVLACRCRAGLRQAADAAPAALLELLRQCDAFRRRERLDEWLAAATLAEPALQAGAGRLRAALAAAAAVDAGAIARAAARPADIPAALDAARSEAIARAVA
jgi:tRNA nucleotidyltransferase (CCA-adding enzyme)